MNETEKQITELYQDGMAMLAIEKKVGVSRTVIRKILARNNVAVRPDTRTFLSDEQKEQVAARCRLGNATIEEIAEEFGVSYQTVSRISVQNGITQTEGRRPTSTVDHSAFDVLTPEALYWMGYLFADGSLSFPDNGSPSLVVHISDKDQNHLEKFRDFLKSNHAIGTIASSKNNFGGGAIYFKVRSEQLVAMLFTRGMTKKPDRLPTKELCDSADFWRGVVDGDGYINVKHVRVLVGGGANLLDAFQQFLTKNAINISLQTEKKIEVSGDAARRLIRLLYTNGPSSVRQLLKIKLIQEGAA